MTDILRLKSTDKLYMIERCPVFEQRLLLRNNFLWGYLNLFTA